MQLIKPMPFAEAVAKLGARSIIGSDLSSSQWSDVPVALREAAFFSSRVESVRFLQRGKDSLSDFLTSARETITRPDGSTTTALKTGSRADFVEQMQQFALAEGMGPLKPEHAGTIQDITSEKRLALIFDTQTKMAQSYGAWRQGMDPDVLDEFPGRRFVRIGEVDDPRPNHTQWEDHVELATNLGFWIALNEDFGTPHAPFGWGCLHDTDDVDRDECEQRGLLKPGERVQPAVEAYNERLAAGTRGLDPDLIAALKDGLGDQLEVDGDRVRWRSSPAAVPAPAPGQTPAATAPEAPPVIPAWQVKLNDLLTDYDTSSLAEQRYRRELAREALSVPESARKPVALTYRARDRGVRMAAAAGNDIIARYVSPDLTKDIKLGVAGTRRSRAYQLGDSIYLRPSSSASTAAHEIMHAVEIQNPRVLDASAEFLLRRAPGEEPVRLSKLTADGRFKSYEVALKDKWAELGGSHYAGKVYKRTESQPLAASNISATEVLTKGIERLHRDPLEFYRRDPEYFRFVIQTLNPGL